MLSNYDNSDMLSDEDSVVSTGNLDETAGIFFYISVDYTDYSSDSDDNYSPHQSDLETSDVDDPDNTITRSKTPLLSPM